VDIEFHPSFLAKKEPKDGIMQMKIGFHFINFFWLMLPLLAWNIILGPRIVDPRIISDDRSPRGLLLSENVSRILVFVFPVLLPLQLVNPSRIAGLVIYIFGTLIYFTSWLPFVYTPHSKWSNSSIGLLAPRLTPLLVFLGIAMLGRSWIYLLIAATFTALHIWHGLQNLKIT
jgi:hypothetical protein